MPSGGCLTPYIANDMHIFIKIGYLDAECAHLLPDLVIECVAFFFDVNRMRCVPASLRYAND